MKKLLNPMCMCMCVATLITSCQKQEIALEPRITTPAEVELSQDELLRIQLLSSNCIRSKDDILKMAANYLPSTFTKSANISISDSLIYGEITKTTDQEPLVLYIVNSDNGYAIIPNSTLLPDIIAFSDNQSYLADDMAPAFKFMMDYTAERLIHKRDSI